MGNKNIGPGIPLSAYYNDGRKVRIGDVVACQKQQYVIIGFRYSDCRLTAISTIHRMYFVTGQFTTNGCKSIHPRSVKSYIPCKTKMKWSRYNAWLADRVPYRNRPEQENSELDSDDEIAKRREQSNQFTPTSGC